MLANLSLKLKLLLSSGVAGLALLILMFTGSIGINSGIEGVQEIGRHRLPSILALQKLQGYQTALRSSTYETALWENDPEAQDMFKGIADDKRRIWQHIDEAWKEYERIPRSSEEDTLWQAFAVEWGKWKTFDNDTVKLIDNLGQNADPVRQAQLFQDYYLLGGQQRPAYQAAEKLLAQVLELNAKNVQAVTDSADEATRSARVVMLVAGGGAFIASTALALLIIMNILRQLGGEPRDAVEIANRIAQGNLTDSIQVQGGDNASLMAAIANMQAQLRALIGEVMQSATELTRRSQALAKDVDQVSRNGAEEAHAAQDTADAVHQIAARVNKIDEAADRAKQLSDLAGGLSQEGQVVINDVVREMENVSTSVHHSSGLIQQLGNYSNQISNIVLVIKEIADQTNLLALNAAIEAARAGEQGRGFAVVADEVRKLAERTGSSTDEISGVIATIQQGVSDAVEGMHSVSDQVEGGVRLVRNASGSMERIHSGALDASSAVNNIHAALNESTASLDAIEHSMANIVGLVDNNGKAVGTMTASSKRVEELAGNLANAIERFRI